MLRRQQTTTDKTPKKNYLANLPQKVGSENGTETDMCSAIQPYQHSPAVQTTIHIYSGHYYSIQYTKMLTKC